MLCGRGMPMPGPGGIPMFCGIPGIWPPAAAAAAEAWAPAVE
jgi:hypothetical protein